VSSEYGREGGGGGLGEDQRGVTEQVADREARKVKDAEVKVQQSRLVKEAALKAIADTEREESARVAKMLEYREELLDQLRSVTPPPPGRRFPHPSPRGAPTVTPLRDPLRVGRDGIALEMPLAVAIRCT
jgi:hypothetical protein